MNPNSNDGQAAEKKNYFGFEVDDVAKAIVDLEELQDKIGRGMFEAFIPMPEGGHERLKELMGDQYDPKAAEQRVRNILKGALTEGLMLKDAIGLSPASMEAFYYLAYCFYQNDRLAESLALFKVLCALDPMQWKYFYALAATLHKQKNFEVAAVQYLMATSLHPQDRFALGHFHSADCYAQLGDWTSAIVAIGMAVDACDESVEEQRALRQRARDLEQVYLLQLQGIPETGPEPEPTEN